MEQNGNIRQELSLACQRLESQATIKEMEIEIAILRTQNQMLSQQKDVSYLSESTTSFIDIETKENQIAENFEEEEGQK
jgi:hypothetical protein